MIAPRSLLTAYPRSESFPVAGLKVPFTYSRPASSTSFDLHRKTPRTSKLLPLRLCPVMLKRACQRTPSSSRPVTFQTPIRGAVQGFPDWPKVDCGKRHMAITAIETKAIRLSIMNSCGARASTGQNMAGKLRLSLLHTAFRVRVLCPPSQEACPARSTRAILPRKCHGDP